MPLISVQSGLNRYCDFLQLVSYWCWYQIFFGMRMVLRSHLAKQPPLCCSYIWYVWTHQWCLQRHTSCLAHMQSTFFLLPYVLSCYQHLAWRISWLAGSRTPAMDDATFLKIATTMPIKRSVATYAIKANKKCSLKVDFREQSIEFGSMSVKHNIRKTRLRNACLCQRPYATSDLDRQKLQKGTRVIPHPTWSWNRKVMLNILFYDKPSNAP